MTILRKKVKESIGITGLVLVFVLIVILVPVLLIWIINTLFGTNTPYTFWTWLASVLFLALFSNSNREKTQG